MKTITIDGSYGEGGGQIIRTSLSLAAITKQSVLIRNIRANRPNPGLQAQHLTACFAVNKISNGELNGATLKSTELLFKPGDIAASEYEFDVGTAGSVTLVAQTIIPILLQASEASTIRIIGGTHVIKSPSYDYFAQVFLPALQNLGVNVKSRLIRPGFYPKGGGIMELSVNPSILHGCCQWPSEGTVKAIIRLARLPEHIAERERNILINNQITNIEVYYHDSFSPGNAVTLWKACKGAYVAGERGKPAEIVAQEAVERLNSETADVDCHLADQLLIYSALTHDAIAYHTSYITEHFRTNAYIITQFTQKHVDIDDNLIKVN